jgi:type II secretory pathway component PulJ
VIGAVPRPGARGAARKTPRSAPRRARGFGLIELMVSIVPGMIVSGAAVAFVLSSLSSNTEFVRTARLNQDLRGNMDYVTRELRRAGYDEDALRYVALSASNNITSPFASIKVLRGAADNSCVIYSYDTRASAVGGVGGPGKIDLAAGEVRALRRMTRTVNGRLVGVMEVAQSSTAAPALDCDAAGPDYSNYPASCNDNTGWCPLSDPLQLDITRFRIVDTSLWTPPSASANGSKVRDLDVAMSGVLIGANQVARDVQSSVRVRAECLRPVAASATPDTTGSLCDVAPGA